MPELSFSILELIAILGLTLGVLFFGRRAKSRACMFVPIDPITIVFYFLLILITYLTFHYGALSLFSGFCIVMAGLVYIPGYAIGTFSYKGIVELQISDKKIILKARRIAYYYNMELKTHCIQVQKIRKCLKRMLFGVHDTMDFPFNHVQVLTSVEVDIEYFSLKIDGGMTYLVIPEKRTIKRGRFTFSYEHFKFVPCDITKLGPYDFFVNTQLYLAAMEIANEANALRIKAEIDSHKAAAEGGATIIKSINKLDPANAAATLDELKEFVESQAKTLNEKPAAEDDKKEESKPRWWQFWRRKQ